MEKKNKIEISESTMELINLKSKLSDLYSSFAVVLNKIDPRGENPMTRKLQDSLLDVDIELMNYLANHIEEKMLETKFESM